MTGFIKPKTHVMLDLETLDTQPSAVILAIGAVKFDKDEVLLGQSLLLFPEWEGTVACSTMEWWSKQAPESKNQMFNSTKRPLAECLAEVKDFCGDLPVWGNGSDFDNAIVNHRCKALGLTPLPYRNTRCFRTVKNLFDSTAWTKPGIAHNPLSDAVAQAVTLINLAKRFNIPL